jgi:hypothetical protein
MTKAIKAQLQELKANIEGVHRFEEEGSRYGMLIIDRGELLFFQQNDDALLCDVSARYSLINPASIKEWDNGHKITEEERAALLEKIIHFYKKAYKDELKVFNG